MSKTKIKTVAVKMPGSRDEVETIMQRIGELQGIIKRRETELNEKINALKTEAAQDAAPINEEITELFKQCHAFAEANKDTLLVGRSRTVKMGAGDMGWRRNPPKCSIRGVDAVIESLERLGFTEAVRTKKEVAKDVILNDAERYQDVKGISVSQTEEFFVKPNETELEKAEVIK